MDFGNRVGSARSTRGNMSKMRALAILILAAGGVTSTLAQFTGPAPLAWRWQQPTDVAPSGGPVVDGDTIYVASGQRMYAINRVDGNQKWRFPVGNPLASNFRGAPALGGGLVIAAADNRTLYACDAATGKRVWEYPNIQSIVGTPQVSTSLVLFQQADGSVMAVNLKDGTPAYTTPIYLKEGSQGSFNVWNDEVLLFSQTSVLYAINVATEKVTWQRETAGVHSDVFPVVTADSIYFVSNNYLVALNAGNGRARFSKSVDEQLVLAPAVSKAGIIAVSREGKAYVFGPNGEVVSKGIDLKSPPIVRPAAVEGGLFVVATFAGTINLIDPKTGVTWNYPIRPIGGTQEVQRNQGGGLGSGAGGGKGGFGSGGNNPGDSGGGGGQFGQQGGGQFGGQGGGGQFGGQGGASATIKIYTVQAAGAPVVSGNTLLILARDGSLLAFDKDNGVDLTPPKVTMTYPNAGDAVSPRPPLALVFKFEDEASGVNEGSIKITADGKPLDFEYTREGLAIVRSSMTGKNRLRLDGKMHILIEVADWMGNIGHTEFILEMDDTIEPVKSGNEDPNGPGKGGGKGGLGGLGGGG